MMSQSSVSPTSKNALFVRWRWTVFSSMFIGWSLYMFCRRSLPSSIPSLIQHNGFSEEDVGLIASSFASSYGVSKFLGSLLSDHFSSKRMFSLGLVLSGIGCIVFPITKSLYVCSMVWFTVGIVQGAGWPPCAILLRKWYAPSQMGTWWSILTSAGNIAGAISPIFFTELTEVISWSWAYFIVGASSCFVGLGLLLLIKDSPSDLGVETSWGSEKEKEKLKKESGSPSPPWYTVFLLKDLWIVSIMYAILYLVKSSIGDWGQLYFIQVAKKPKLVSAACISMTQFGGMVGSLCTGYVSDLLLTPQTEQTKCPRAPMFFGLSLLMTLALHLFASTTNEQASEVWLSILVFVIGFLTNGSIVIIGLIAMEVAPKKLVGSAHGLACAVAQVGSFMAGWPFAHTVERYSWTSAYYLLEVASVVMVGLASYLLILLLRGLAANRQKQKQN